MNQPYNRISENALFTLLLTALVGWLTAPAASDLLSTSAPDACGAAIVTVHHS